MQGVSEGENPPPRQIPAHLHGSSVLHRGPLLSLKKDGTSEKVPSALPALLAPVLLQVGTGKDVLRMQKLLPTIHWAKLQGKRWCSLCFSCVYPTCQWTIKTGHWKINLTASKSPQESILNGIIFFLFFSDPFFTVEVDIFFLLLNQHFLTANHSQKFSIQPWSGFQHLVLVHAYGKKLMSISENYLHAAQKGTNSEDQHLHVGKSRHSCFFASELGSAFLWSFSFVMVILLCMFTAQLTCHSEKNPSMGSTVFRDTAHPLSNTLGTFWWF